VLIHGRQRKSRNIARGRKQSLGDSSKKSRTVKSGFFLRLLIQAILENACRKDDYGHFFFSSQCSLKGRPISNGVKCCEQPMEFPQLM
jgi:hypothetical protein